MEKVLHLLHDQLRVHGISILTGMSELGSKPDLHYEGVATCCGDIQIRLS